MRLKSEIWVKAYLRNCQAQLTPALVVRHGDNDAGAIFIKVNCLDGTGKLFGPAPGGLDEAACGQLWMAHLDGPDVSVSEAKIDDFLHRQIQFDGDAWIIEVEDKKGRHWLGEWLR
ncbi:MAG: DUF1491 family protein [Pseudomonadota bacterium]